MKIFKLLKQSLLLFAVSLLVSCAAFRPASEGAANQYSPEMAKTLIDFSILAYEKNEKILKKKLKEKYPQYKLLRKVEESENDYDTQGFVAYSQDRVIVAMRGSSSLKDWVNNFKIIRFTTSESKKYCPNAGVHGGFHKSALQVKNLKMKNGDLVIKEIERLHKEGRNIYFTGHSLGGAISNVLAFFSTYEAKIKISGIYTYGEPKSGNRYFQECHDNKLRDVTFRFVNDRDAVTRIPQSRDYAHVGNLIYFDTYENIYDIATYNSKFGMIKDCLTGDCATDHFKENYQKLVYKHDGINPFVGE